MLGPLMHLRNLLRSRQLCSGFVVPNQAFCQVLWLPGLGLRVRPLPAVLSCTLNSTTLTVLPISSPLGPY